MHDSSRLPSPEVAPADPSAEIDQLREALASRTVTAQATGILAARFHLSTDHGWALLRETSNLSNRRLSDIARIVVDTHDGVPISDQADQRIAVALVQVLDLALARIHAKVKCTGQSTDVPVRDRSSRVA